MSKYIYREKHAYIYIVPVHLYSCCQPNPLHGMIKILPWVRLVAGMPCSAKQAAPLRTQAGQLRRILPWVKPLARSPRSVKPAAPLRTHAGQLAVSPC